MSGTLNTMFTNYTNEIQSIHNERQFRPRFFAIEQIRRCDSTHKCTLSRAVVRVCSRVAYFHTCAHSLQAGTSTSTQMTSRSPKYASLPATFLLLSYDLLVTSTYCTYRNVKVGILLYCTFGPNDTF